MNEKLYRWTFNFHKVVRQHNSGAVEDFILQYSADYLRIQKWKNYWNRSTFGKVIIKIKVAPFLWPTVYSCTHCKQAKVVLTVAYENDMSAFLTNYCRAMLAQCAVMILNVRLSVRPSVTIRYRVQIRWNSSKIISRPNSLRPMRSLTPNTGDLVQREHPQN